MKGFRTCLILATVLISQSLLVTSIKVNSDGGYEVVVAIDEATEVPKVGITRYIDNIMTSLGAFSQQLWLSTNNTFYFKSVDILVPSKWDVESPLSATTQSYDDADIRISLGTTYPHAENLYSCGQPGNAIDLPESFFETATSGAYGLHRKSLLNLWAIYRFGVHPEHGVVGDSRFPYSYWDRQKGELSVTGCSDEPVKGTFVDITNSDATCDTAESASNTNCRFQPDRTGQNATSSLMFFHWVDTVDQFCDSHNHNKQASNQQNAHCDHKSVWEVIRETPDYQAATSKVEGLPRITFNFIKRSQTPLFYLLLDRGRIQGSYQVANLVPPLLAKFVGESGLAKTIASIGAFPGKNGSPLEELVPWSEIGQNTAAFYDSIGVLLANGSLQRDFSKALVAVADEIKQREHLNGTVVLLVKFGADVENFDTYLPEPEVLTAFNEGNIVLHAIELNFPNHTGASHLAPVCQETRGSYVVLDNYGEAEGNVGSLLNFVRNMLREHYSELDRDWKTLRKNTLNTATAIPLTAGLNSSFQMFVSSSDGGLSSDNFSVTGFNSTSGNRDLTFSLRKTLDWNEVGSKHTYRLEVAKSELEDVSLVTLRVACTSENCSNSVIARGEFTEDINQKVKITVKTSVENSQADLSSGRPISIFAKVVKGGVPVDGAQVIASLKETASSAITLIELRDDGDYTPDVQKLDGIYSAYFAPEEDGQFELSVTVQGNPSIIHGASLQDGFFTQLLPVDQEDVGCGSANCNTGRLEDSYSQNVALSGAFSVVQASEYIPTPTKILTLKAQDKPEQRQVIFYWQAPSIPGRQQSVSSYEVRSAPLLELLITNFDDQTVIPFPPDFNPTPPGGTASLTITRPGSTTYYAIRSVYGDKKSAISNIVDVVIQDPVDPTTTTTTTSSTTPDPTQTTTVTPPNTGSTDEDESTSTTTGSSTSPGGSDTTTTTPPTTTQPSSTTAGTGKTMFSSVAVCVTILTVLLNLLV